MSFQVNRYVGSRLRLARKRAGLSELQMAAKLNVEPFDYREFETGRRRLDAPNMLICSRLTGVPLSWFFVGYYEDKSSRCSPQAGANERPVTEVENVIKLKPPALPRDAKS